MFSNPLKRPKTTESFRKENKKKTIWVSNTGDESNYCERQTEDECTSGNPVSIYDSGKVNESKVQSLSSVISKHDSEIHLNLGLKAAPASVIVIVSWKLSVYHSTQSQCISTTYRFLRSYSDRTHSPALMSTPPLHNMH